MASAKRGWLSSFLLGARPSLEKPSNMASVVLVARVFEVLFSANSTSFNYMITVYLVTYHRLNVCSVLQRSLQFFEDPDIRYGEDLLLGFKRFCFIIVLKAERSLLMWFFYTLLQITLLLRLSLG